jgi:hypothetical protein
MLLGVCIAVHVCLVATLARAQSISSSERYAWSDQVGYVNFERVEVTDTAITGYAWAANAGWINMAPTTGGVFNDGQGTLSGYAWGSQIGWVNFSGVRINTTDGSFSGAATGSGIGTLTFDCSSCTVRTSWRPPASRTGPNANPPSVSLLQPQEESVSLPLESAPAIAPSAEDTAGARMVDIMQDGQVNIPRFQHAYDSLG